MDRFDMLALALVLALGSDKGTKKKETKTKVTASEDTIDILDRDITFGLRDIICIDNFCGDTNCPLYIDKKCICNHAPKDIKVSIPTKYIDAEAEHRKGIKDGD